VSVPCSRKYEIKILLMSIYINVTLTSQTQDMLLQINWDIVAWQVIFWNWSKEFIFYYRFINFSSFHRPESSFTSLVILPNYFKNAFLYNLHGASVCVQACLRDCVYGEFVRVNCIDQWFSTFFELAAHSHWLKKFCNT